MDYHVSNTGTMVSYNMAITGPAPTPAVEGASRYWDVDNTNHTHQYKRGETPIASLTASHPRTRGAQIGRIKG
ncbi:hypothetical protein AVEN_144280-1 [Araneus ventricosus]|uniref:Uncharacterized protein n=1 Tax=Araneus ventricosus TaxID=182803 RepID=A0A4Y2H7H6_ARAVE|nr:hypothetical protein AVEN_144280-1 [Araneus ventricosus]